MGPLEGKVAIVTGAARGQGEAEARRFVAGGAKVVGNCITKRGKSCKGRLKSKFTKTLKKRGKIKAKKFLRKRYPAGVKLEVVISKKGFVSQVKTVTIRKNKEPTFVAKCMRPPSKKRVRC